MTYKPQFRKGRCYLRHDGKPVRIVAEQDDFGPHYRCVQGDDGEGRWEVDLTDEEGFIEWIDASTLGWRYDRASDPGRCTGSSFFHDPRNLVVGSNWTLRALWYRIRCEFKDAVENFPGEAFACGWV